MTLWDVSAPANPRHLTSRDVATAAVTASAYDPVPIGSIFTLSTKRDGLITLVEPTGYSSGWGDHDRFTQGDCGA